MSNNEQLPERNYLRHFDYINNKLVIELFQVGKDTRLNELYADTICRRLSGMLKVIFADYNVHGMSSDVGFFIYNSAIYKDAVTKEIEYETDTLYLTFDKNLKMEWIQQVLGSIS